MAKRTVETKDRRAKRLHKRVVYCGACGWRGIRYRSLPRDRQKPCPHCGHEYPKRRWYPSKAWLASCARGGKNANSYRPFRDNPALAAEAGRKSGRIKRPRPFAQDPKLARRAQRQSVIIRSINEGKFPPRPTFTWKW